MKKDSQAVGQQPPSLLNRQQQAQWAGISVAQLDKLHAAGRGPRVLFLGSRRMARAADLDAWASSQIVDSADAPRQRTGKPANEQAAA